MATRTTEGAGHPSSRPWLPGPEQTAAGSDRLPSREAGPHGSDRPSAESGRSGRRCEAGQKGEAFGQSAGHPQQQVPGVPAWPRRSCSSRRSLGVSRCGRSPGGPRGDALTRSLSRSLAYSLASSPTCSLTQSFTHSLIHSLTHSLTHLLTHLLTHPLAHLLTHLLSHSLAHSLTRLLAHSFTHSLVHSHSFIPQLTGCARHPARQAG